MQPMNAGVTKAVTGMDGIVWNILGQTYVPKQLSEHCFTWHAMVPAGSFVPAQTNPAQEQFVYVLRGRLEIELQGRVYIAEAGDLMRLPKGQAHAVFNKTEDTAECLCWATPAGRLYDLFWAIHSMKEQNLPEVAALAAVYDVEFLPPE